MGAVNNLTNMSIDEVSLVRKPANQHAAIVFSKSLEGDEMPAPTIYAEDGTEVDIDDLEVGTVIQGEDGVEYVVSEGDDFDGDQPDDQYDEADEVGKSFDDYADLIAKAYSEAVTEDDRSALIAGVAREAAIAKAEAATVADNIAKMQDEAYINTCISKADDYGFAGPRTVDFGVAISKMLTVLDESEIQLMDDIFKAFSELAYEANLGTEAYGESDVLGVVNAQASEIVKSAGGDVDELTAFTAAFEANPDLYSQYRDEQMGRI